jgi:hypothetical protein
MGSQLGPTLADIIMTELENIVIKPILACGTLKFYARYGDHLSKSSNIPLILLKLNSFDTQIQFTHKIITNNDDVHFHDIIITPILALLSTANLPSSGNASIYFALHFGVGKFLGYVPLFIVLIKYVVTMNNY